MRKQWCKQHFGRKWQRAYRELVRLKVRVWELESHCDGWLSYLHSFLRK